MVACVNDVMHMSSVRVGTLGYEGPQRAIVRTRQIWAYY